MRKYVCTYSFGIVGRILKTAASQILVCFVHRLQATEAGEFDAGRYSFFGTLTDGDGSLEGALEVR